MSCALAASLLTFAIPGEPRVPPAGRSLLFSPVPHSAETASCVDLLAELNTAAFMAEEFPDVKERTDTLAKLREETLGCCDAELAKLAGMAKTIESFGEEWRTSSENTFFVKQQMNHLNDLTKDDPADEPFGGFDYAKVLAEGIEGPALTEMIAEMRAFWMEEGFPALLDEPEEAKEQFDVAEAEVLALLGDVRPFVEEFGSPVLETMEEVKGEMDEKLKTMRTQYDDLGTPSAGCAFHDRFKQQQERVRELSKAAEVPR